MSVGFHERYTSGRVVSRLTSDMDSIAELVDGGIDDLVLAGLSVVSVAGILLWLDPPLAAVTLLSFPFLLLLSRWFARASARAYRRTRETVALVIIHFVESLGGIRAVQAFRREPRNQEIFQAVNDDYRRANLRAFRLIAVYSPGDQAHRQRHGRGGAHLRRLAGPARAAPKSVSWPRSCSTCAGSSSRCRS